MKIQKMKIPAILGALLVAGTLSAGAQMNSDSLYKEPYRPQYHFSPEKGWIGDPSGFMYYQGKYHMYWWGKVESTDLVHYQQITPYAMTGADDNISYFTGSAVVDKNNTAGFGKGAYVAAYTVFEKDSKKQAQGISFSHDGKTFHYYEGNPVLDLWSTEFRDPTVFWHEPTQKWVMVVAKALEKKIKFYTSPDLKSWTWTSDFGPAGDSEKSWECPDLFQLPVDGDSDKKRWVMVVSVNWAQEQYFIGDFDGTSFKLMDNHPAEPLYVDKGITKIIGLAIANGLCSLSGCIFAQQQRYFDISMGTGTMVIGLASVIIGISLLKKATFLRVTSSVVIGAIVYKACVAIAIKLGMPSSDLKLITAVLFLIILVLGMDRNKRKKVA